LAELEIRKTDGRKLPRLVIIIDEVAEVLEVAGDRAAEAIRRITALGRELGVHIILATQHPTARVLGGSLAKANLGFRLVGRVADGRASSLATGQKDLGAHLLRGNGDFLAVIGDVGHRVQTALVSEEDIARLPQTDQTATLPLRDLNLDRALEVGLTVPLEEAMDSRAEIITPQQVATALAFQRGNTWLCRHLGIGAAKAKRIREEWEFPILTELRRLGFKVCTINDDEVSP
jgi:S-DNA-T family DNA segregation ATPase FtsK/SpoIIIE